MKNRFELAKYLADMGCKKGAEVGVFEGVFSKTLLENIPELNLLCVDNWSTDTGWGIKKNEAAFPKAQKTLAPYSNVMILKGNSTDVSKSVVDESLDFVYIDADHSYEAVKADINAWAPKVRKGGIVSGHDYFEARTLQVMKAVDEYAREHHLEVKVTEWDYENPIADDRQPNWYFTKL